MLMAFTGTVAYNTTGTKFIQHSQLQSMILNDEQKIVLHNRLENIQHIINHETCMNISTILQKIKNDAAW